MNKKEVIKYLEEEELNIQSANAAVLAADLVFSAYVDSDIVHGINYTPIFFYISYKDLKAFFQILPQKLIDKVAKKVYLDYCKNPKSLDDKLKKHKDLEKQLAKIWQNYQKSKDKLSDEQMLKIYQRFIKVSKEWWYYGVIGEDKAEIINQEVVPRFAKRHDLDLKKAREIIIILSHPKIQSVFNLERKHFLDICISFLKKDKNLGKKIKSYIKNYFWFKTDFYKTREITPKSLLKEVSSEISKNKRTAILKEFKDIDRNFQKINEQRNKLLSSLKLTNKDKKEIHFSQLSSYWFDQRKLGTMIQFHYLFSFLKDFAKRYNLKYHELALYTVDELETFLAKKKRISKKNIKGRDEGAFIVYEKNAKTKLFYGKEAKEMFKIATYIKKGEYAKKEIKGQVASTGGLKKMKGKVKIIYNPAEDKFKQGKILVTSMTRIEFVPYMRKARAIITNEGGIACHAAIISRELGIPCIIGTKVATKALKTGDNVELNLKTGVIKIIK